MKMTSVMTEQYENYIIIGTSWNLITIFSCNGLKVIKKKVKGINGEVFSILGKQRQILTIRLSKPLRSLSVIDY